MKDLICEIIDKNALISSPAGAGKTRILTELFLEFLRRGVSVNEIVATTYTNKAAGEIKERIITGLFKEEQERQNLLKEYFSGARRIRAFTIHSFLNDLLQVVIPSFAIPGRRLPAELSESIFREIAISCVREFHDRALKKRKISTADETPPEIRGIVFDIASEKDIFYILWLLYQKLPLSFFWAQKIKNIPYEGAVSHFKSEELAAVYKDISFLFEDAFYRFLAWKLERGYFEFHDIEFFAYLMVSIESSDPENLSGADWRDLLLYFNENFKVVLIDEFQDTSKLQWEIIRFLTGERFAGVGLSETTRSFVCLIGDPKQSIYSFRNADVSVMQQVDREFSYLESKNPGLYRKLCVTVNRRSKKPVVDFVNAIFSKLMKARGDGAPLWVTCYEPFTDERGEKYSKVTAVFDQGENLSSRDRAKWEAKFIASEIRRLIEENVLIEDREGTLRKIKYSDIAILLKVKTHLSEYEKELTRAGIPFVAVDGSYETNRVFQFLKSFFIACGKPFENGHFVKMMGVLGCEYSHLQGDGITTISSVKNPEVKIISRAFSEYLRLFEDNPFEAYSASVDMLAPLFRGLSEKTDISTALRVLREIFSLAEEEGVCTPFEMAEFIEQTLSEGSIEIHPESDAVSLMSIHKSKGLEFSIVFAAALWARGRDDHNLVMYPGSGDDLCEIAFKFPDRGRKNLKRKDHIPEALLNMDEYLEEKKNEFREFNNEEIKRLFYVAFTRARDYLYVLLPSLKRSQNQENKETYQELYEIIRELDIPEFEKIYFDLSEKEEPGYSGKPKTSKYDYLKEKYRFPFEVEEREPELLLVRKRGPVSKRVKKGPYMQSAMKVGTVVHEILFEVKMGITGEDDIDARAVELCRYHNADEEEAQKAAELAKFFLSTPEGKKLIKSAGRPEFTFLTLDKGGYRVMRLDLLYEEDDKICIVDYKTDAELSDLYYDQIVSYVKGVSMLYPGREVIGKVISIRTGEMIAISNMDSDMDGGS